MIDTQGHNLDPTLERTTISRTSYKAEDHGWFLASKYVNAEGIQCRLQTGPHTLNEIEQMLKPIQAAEDPDLEEHRGTARLAENILQREQLVESAFIRWIEDRAMRLAEHVKAERNGNEHEMNRSSIERTELVEAIVDASTEYVAWTLLEE